MAPSTPFSQLTGTLTFWLAPYGEAVPEPGALPAGNWIEFGSTDGDQKIKHGGKTTVFRDNDHQGPVKIVRHEEDIMVKFKIVDLTLENYGRAISTAAAVVQQTTPGGVVVKKLPLKRGAYITDFALLAAGDKISPYGIFPGYYVWSRVNFTSEPEPTFAKNGRPALEIEATILEDDALADADRMGYLMVQIQ